MDPNTIQNKQLRIKSTTVNSLILVLGLFFGGGRGDVCDHSHEGVLVALLMRTSSWPYSRGRPRGLTHEDVLVAIARGRIQ